MLYQRGRITLLIFNLVLLLALGSFTQTTTSGQAAAPTSGAPTLLGQPLAQFQARRKALMQQITELEAQRARSQSALGGGGSEVVYEPIVVLLGQTEEDSGEGKYRQKNYFAYLTGVETPSAYLILQPQRDRETLYIPPRDLANERWTGPQLGPGAEAATTFGFQRVDSTENFMSDLLKAIGDPQKPMRQRSRIPVIYTIAPEGRSATITREYQFVQLLNEAAPTTRVKDVTPMLAEMRKAKDTAELALLQKAIDITGQAHAEVIKHIRPGIYEYELEGKILGTFIGSGALRAGFPSIVGAGLNSTVLHYNENQHRIEAGDLVVIDIGAEYKYYTADITRTYPASGKFTPRQREIYQLVLAAQRAAAAQMKPGVTKLREMTQWVKEYLKQSRLRARDNEGKEQTMDYFFIHGLSHYLGMDVHDVGDYNRPLQVGEVFTIEPGIYIPSERLGVRIEDDYVMTERGLERLSNHIPSEPDEIERLIAQASANAGRK